MYLSRCLLNPAWGAPGASNPVFLSFSPGARSRSPFRPRQTASLEAGAPGRARGKAGVGFNQHCQRTRIRCGYVSGHVYINQYFRYNLVNSFNSKRMLKPGKLSGTRESVIFRKILLNQLAWLKYFDRARG